MAMIKCPECSKDISDKAAFCPHCGHDMKNSKFTVCEECGTRIPEGNTYCPECGCPCTKAAPENKMPKLKDAAPKEKNKKKSKKTIIIILSVLVILAVVAAIVISEVNKNNYKNSMIETANDITAAESTAENHAGLMRDVWNNCIFEIADSVTDVYTKDYNDYFYSDFNDAINNLENDQDYQKEEIELVSDETKIETEMAELKNPPKSLQSQYDALIKLYEDYLVVKELATDASGMSLATYSTKLNDAKSEFSKQFIAVKVCFS